MPQADPPVDGISGKETGRILGIRELSVSRLVNQGVLPKAVRGQTFRLDRADVERVALITAVVIEGRTQSKVAATYGVSKGWVSSSSPATTPRASPLSNRDHGDRRPHRGHWRNLCSG
jgi:hypothetical protein